MMMLQSSDLVCPPWTVAGGCNAQAAEDIWYRCCLAILCRWWMIVSRSEMNEEIFTPPYHPGVMSVRNRD